MEQVWQHVTSHLAAYGVGSGVVIMAAIQCMPKPGEPWNWKTIYTWIYETLQTVLPVNRSARPHQPPTDQQPPTGA
jgi:hypothetical protein